jgi:two-component system phosphate regulon sensor histidine kinase PhoR
MDHLQKFISDVRDRLVLILLINNLVIIADWWLADQVFKLGGYYLLAALIIVPFLSVTIIPVLSTKYLVQPTKLIWQAILHLAPDTSGVPAPNLKSAHLGRELVATLVSHVYQLANVAESVERMANKQPTDFSANFIANSLPLPLVILDKNDNAVFANEAFLNYLELAPSEVTNKSIYSVLDMSFPNEKTFDTWLSQVRANTVTATKNWSRVRLTLADQSTRQFDLAAHYNKDNPDGIETMLILFDHTEQYSQDDQAMSFVALAVHELRTPLTLLRGYIEAFDEDLAGKLNREQTDFMHKMNAAAQQLTAFVNNILNVARIEGDQLFLQLQEENWKEILESTVESWRLRANVRGIELECSVAPDLPTVGVDRMAIYEVVSNLIDNAIKYSGASHKIIVKSELSQEGLVETSVQDFGVGIPATVLANLFTKFYRNHHNRAQIGGTGLGLYLSKTIVSAHGGNIWVRSKEGEGTTFGFTILPYSQLAEEQKNSDNKDITRGAHGWIKNHSLYRR